MVFLIPAKVFNSTEKYLIEMFILFILHQNLPPNGNSSTNQNCPYTPWKLLAKFLL